MNQVFMEVPMWSMSYSGGAPKDKNLFCFVANDPVTRIPSVHIFKLKITATEMLLIVKKAYDFAVEIKNDPFAIKRPLAETPEVNLPVFHPHEVKRENLTSKSVVGFGQVRLSPSIYYHVTHSFSIVR